MVIELTTHGEEEGTLILTAAYADEDENPVTPNSAKWTWTDEEGNVVNSRLEVTIPDLSTTNDIVLTGDDLALKAGESSIGIRLFTLDVEYDSDIQSGLSIKKEWKIIIDGLQNVPAPSS